ncbi:MAG: hypothetical protein HXX19_15490 [Rhodoferax sp.]|nr:hypothetical protein [Rhodoferax sp.]
MRGPIVRPFNAQQSLYAAAHSHNNVTKPQVWAPVAELQDLLSHCEVKELNGPAGEKAWEDSLFVQEFVTSFEDTIPGSL